MTCEYNFTLEYYYVLTKACYNCPFNMTDCDRPHCVAADGVQRGIMTVNRMLPGPGIHVCADDMIIVNVHNKLEGAEGNTIHWHGVLQKDFQHMDGVNMITQCPIVAHSTFQYRFKAGNPGTHFWHAHAGEQRSDGIFGNLVIREPETKDPQFRLYDHDLPEHTMIINDWLVELTNNRFAGHHHAGFDNKPRLMLIQGRGAFRDYKHPETNVTKTTPHSVFRVEQGKRYRFRVVSNGILNCPIQFSIDNHSLHMIASDGVPFDSVTVDSFNIFAGERYDFVLHANETVDNYWIRVRGLADCGVKKAKQTAILRYKRADNSLPEGTTTWEDANRQGKKLNPWNKKGTDMLIQVSELSSMLPDNSQMKDVPDKRFYLGMDFMKINNFHFHDPDLYPLSSISEAKHLYSPQVNHISLISPPSPPLTQLSDIPKDLFCNADTVKTNCTEIFCQCIHRLVVDFGDTVELVLVDEGVAFDANHPMHLHGHNFRVVAMDKVNRSTTVEYIKSLDKEGKIRRKLKGAVQKDTVTVPDGGYTVIRFVANNPGFWLLHCHIEFHIEIGMGVVIQVGKEHDMPVPPFAFPKCGNWHYTGEQPNSISAASRQWMSPLVLILMTMSMSRMLYLSHTVTF